MNTDGASNGGAPPATTAPMPTTNGPLVPAVVHMNPGNTGVVGLHATANANANAANAAAVAAAMAMGMHPPTAGGPPGANAATAAALARAFGVVPNGESTRVAMVLGPDGHRYPRAIPTTSAVAASATLSGHTDPSGGDHGLTPVTIEMNGNGSGGGGGGGGDGGKDQEPDDDAAETEQAGAVTGTGEGDEEEDDEEEEDDDQDDEDGGDSGPSGGGERNGTMGGENGGAEDSRNGNGNGSGGTGSNGGSGGGGGGGGGAGRRKRLTLGQKREVVDLAASKKFTHKELAEKFRVGRTTITNICRQEDIIRTETDSADATKKKRKTTKCTYDLRVLDECLHKWRMEVKVSAPDTKLTGTVLQQKAMDLAMKIAHEPYADLPDKVRLALMRFSASNGWLDGYRTRFGSFSSKQFHGDASVIKNVDIQTRLREIHHSLQGAELEDIWTGSEFAVQFRPTGVAAATLPGQVGPDGLPTNASTGRYTVSLFVNAAGEKFDMQVIGVDRNPLLTEDIDTEKAYNIHYGHSKTGWQVAHTMVSMLKALNGLAKTRKRTFRVILDSAVPHVKAAMILDSQGDQRTFFVYDHLQIYFLPPNFKPPRFHPCHLGVIQAFKARFRYELLETLFSNYRQCVMRQDPQGFHPARYLHTKNVFHWFYVALHSIDKHLIQNCWVQSGLLPTQVIANLNMKEILRASGVGGGHGGHGLVAPPIGTVVPNVGALYRDLQGLMTQIAQVAPDFLHWVGVSDPLNAQAYVEMEGNASVTDPGIDEVQIIRSVLQKHGFLSTKRLDEDSHASGHYAAMADVAQEQCPRHEDVLASVEILKKYLRLSKDVIPERVEAIVQLNKIKANVGNAPLAL